MEDLKASFDCLLGDDCWHEVGITPTQLREWCSFHGRPCYVVSGGSLIDVHLPEDSKQRGVAFCAHDGHCFMYSSTKVVSAWAVVDPSIPRSHRLRGDSMGEAPPFSEWERWEGNVTPRTLSGSAARCSSPGGILGPY